LYQRLTRREAEVLAEVRHGRCSKEIATYLAISKATVNWHVKNVLVKLNAHSRAHAVAVAIDAGLLESSQGPQGL
jgi:DNA-binding CsgD family transcriptional regulator